MKLHTINTGFFKLDGGAMFGIVPKSIWNHLNTADENNMCNWAMRCLLVEDGDRRILIDTGIGNKQSEKFFGFYYLNGNDTLLNSLTQAGTTAEGITDVILTHLHFDHCGGAISKTPEDELIPTFPNATYHITREHWLHAHNPNPREKPSFLPENYDMLSEWGMLNFVEAGQMIGNHIEVKVINGHTVGMICPLISGGERKVFYGADLYSSSNHVPLNYVMAYDIEPLKSMQEKAIINKLAVEENWLIYYEHDPEVQCSTIQVNEKGQYSRGEIVTI